MIFCISIELVLKGKAFLIRTTNKSQQDNGRRGILFDIILKCWLIIQEATASQLAPFCNELKEGPNMPPPLTLAKLNGVCLWIFEELTNYCAWCQYYVTHFFLLQETIQNFVHLKTISLASHPSFQ